MRIAIDTILVPKGAEHQAICRGLRQVVNPPTVFSIPVGSAPLTRYLERLLQNGCLDKGQSVLIMGLCGALTPRLRVGDGVIYRECLSSTSRLSHATALPCDRRLIQAIQQQLNDQGTIVTAVTSDRVICTAAEKQQLAEWAIAEVVDMEGYAALELLSQIGTSVATLRVVSDDCRHDLPDLANAFTSDGDLQPMALASAMFRRPIAASRLIYGSTQGLKGLQRLTQTLFKA